MAAFVTAVVFWLADAAGRCFDLLWRTYQPLLGLWSIRAQSDSFSIGSLWDKLDVVAYSDNASVNLSETEKHN